MKTNNQIKITVGEEFVGLRLDRFLATLPEIVSRSYASDLIDKGLVSVDEKQVRSSHTLKLNQVVEIKLPELVSSELIPYDFKLDIIFEDDDLIVINKPSGLVVHPAAGHEQDTLVNALLHHTKNLSMKNERRPGIVHRIDKETSGLLVVAKNDFTHENLAQQFKDKTTSRIYYALVAGSLNRKKGTLQSYLARHPNDRKRYASVRSNNQIVSSFDEDFNQGKWAVTHFEKIDQGSGKTYLKIKLETGRTHQIRVHLSELGHVLVGDITYGYGIHKAKAENLNRFFLHAAELGFTHPRSGKFLNFSAPWPKQDAEKLTGFGIKLNEK